MGEKVSEMSKSDSGPHRIKNTPDADSSHVKRTRPLVRFRFGKKDNSRVSHTRWPHPFSFAQSVELSQSD